MRNTPLKTLERLPKTLKIDQSNKSVVDVIKRFWRKSGVPEI